jgi:hypothetical protein
LDTSRFDLTFCFKYAYISGKPLFDIVWSKNKKVWGFKAYFSLENKGALPLHQSPVGLPAGGTIEGYVRDSLFERFCRVSLSHHGLTAVVEIDSKTRWA